MSKHEGVFAKPVTATWAAVIVAAFGVFYNHVPAPNPIIIPPIQEEQEYPGPGPGPDPDREPFPPHKPDAPSRLTTPMIVGVASSQERRLNVAGQVREHFARFSSIFGRDLDLNQASAALIDDSEADHHRAFSALLLGAMGHQEAAPNLRLVAGQEGEALPVVAARVGLQMLQENSVAIPVLHLNPPPTDKEA